MGEVRQESNMECRD